MTSNSHFGSRIGGSTTVTAYSTVEYIKRINWITILSVELKFSSSSGLQGCSTIVVLLWCSTYELAIFTYVCSGLPDGAIQPVPVNQYRQPPLSTLSNGPTYYLRSSRGLPKTPGNFVSLAGGSPAGGVPQNSLHNLCWKPLRSEAVNTNRQLSRQC